MVQALAGRLGGAGVGAGGDLHAHQAGEHGPHPPGEEGEGGELGEHLPARAEGHEQQQDKDHQKHLGHRGVLVLQVGVRAGADGGGYLPHGLAALGVGQHPAALDPGKQDRGRGPQKSNQIQLFHVMHSLGFRASGGRSAVRPACAVTGSILPHPNKKEKRIARQFVALNKSKKCPAAESAAGREDARGQLRLQVRRLNSTRMGKSSKRPAIMVTDSTTLDRGENSAKLPTGPIS